MPAAATADLGDGKSGLEVQVGGRTYALFREPRSGAVHAIDGICPHAGGSLAEGAVSGNVVTCPLHGWRFDTCTGCSLDQPDSGVDHYETLVERGLVYIRPDKARTAPARNLP